MHVQTREAAAGLLFLPVSLLLLLPGTLLLQLGFPDALLALAQLSLLALPLLLALVLLNALRLKTREHAQSKPGFPHRYVSCNKKPYHACNNLHEHITLDSYLGSDLFKQRICVLIVINLTGLT